ncbi:citrate lyase ACP [bacterium]|nr:MAG: citrate lyase ACP [bacterium]
MAMTTAGERGEKVRSDVWVGVTDASAAGYDLKTSVESIYGRSLRLQVENALKRFGNPGIHLEIHDSGALPFVIEARLEAAICAHLGTDIPPIHPSPRKPNRARLRRTRLYVPGNGPKQFANAGLYRPDGLILDLEDSVAPDAKLAARAVVRRALATLDWPGCERMVRINDGHDGLDDLRAVAPQGVEAFLIPKVEGPERIHEVATVLDDIGLETLLIPLLESPLGIQNAYAIAKSSPRIVALAIGLEDYATEIRAERSESGEETAFAHGQLVNAARAAGISPLASVFPKIDDRDAVFRYARRMRGLGFDGIGCIHPRQIRSAHAALAPSAEEVERAKRIVAGYEAAMAEGRGAVAVSGRMVDAPIYERARTLLVQGGWL